MIKIKKATILWSESKCFGENVEFTSLSDLSSAMSRISMNCNKNGCYDKTKIKLEWENGAEYEGQWDIKHLSFCSNDYLVKPHVINVCKYINKEGGGDAFTKDLEAGKYEL